MRAQVISMDVNKRRIFCQMTKWPNRHHSCGSWSQPKAENNPSMPTQKQRLSTCAKNLVILSWRLRKTEIFVPGDSKHHSCSLEPSNSAFIFDRFKSLTRWFNSDCVMRCGSPEKHGSKSGSLLLPVSCIAVSSSKVHSSGGFGIGILSSCDTSLIAEGRLGYSIDFLFLSGKPDTLVKQK
ncbi:uncharacterized protein LOC143254984 [Tachypleus tridentatus]|uniref:uncharacterized protein LOC143254984 n=1 Tax=Tachypleus tridentatus TaxID=6853 RepID=UPI003FD5849D